MEKHPTRKASSHQVIDRYTTVSSTLLAPCDAFRTSRTVPIAVCTRSTSSKKVRVLITPRSKLELDGTLLHSRCDDASDPAAVCCCPAKRPSLGTTTTKGRAIPLIEEEVHFCDIAREKHQYRKHVANNEGCRVQGPSQGRD